MGKTEIEGIVDSAEEDNRPGGQWKNIRPNEDSPLAQTTGICKKPNGEENSLGAKNVKNQLGSNVTREAESKVNELNTKKL